MEAYARLPSSHTRIFRPILYRTRVQVKLQYSLDISIKHWEFGNFTYACMCLVYICASTFEHFVDDASNWNYISVVEYPRMRYIYTFNILTQSRCIRSSGIIFTFIYVSTKGMRAWVSLKNSLNLPQDWKRLYSTAHVLIRVSCR